jgi:hypothetical protein
MRLLVLGDFRRFPGLEKRKRAEPKPRPLPEWIAVLRRMLRRHSQVIVFFIVVVQVIDRVLDALAHGLEPLCLDVFDQSLESF